MILNPIDVMIEMYWRGNRAPCNDIMTDGILMVRAESVADREACDSLATQGGPMVRSAAKVNDKWRAIEAACVPLDFAYIPEGERELLFNGQVADAHRYTLAMLVSPATELRSWRHDKLDGLAGFRDGSMVWVLVGIRQ